MAACEECGLDDCAEAADTFAESPETGFEPMTEGFVVPPLRTVQQYPGEV